MSTKKKRKSYAQPCSVSMALDIVGERWTLLILRELLGGPARFHELQSGLHGIPKNLLTERLRQLENDQLLERVQLYGSSFYSLTQQGASIRTAIEELGIWGGKLQRVSPVEHPRSIRSVATTLQAILNRIGGPLPEKNTHLELQVDSDFLALVLGPAPTVTVRRSHAPEAIFKVSHQSLCNYLDGQGLEAKALNFVSGNKSMRSILLKALKV